MHFDLDNLCRKIAAEKKRATESCMVLVIVHHHTLKLFKMSKDQDLSFALRCEVRRSSKCQNLLSSLYVGV